jgi:hypothetical protein
VRSFHDGFDTGALELWMAEGFRVVAPVLELELPRASR